MNQILNTKMINKKKTNKNFFRLQFIVSSIILFSFIIFLIYSFFNMNKKEKLSDSLLGNYNIYKLYANNLQDTTHKQDNENNIFGVIEIPKININYPIFSNLSEELLKISPCKFYGTNLKENGNICIAGHNYNNDMFFSNLYLLNNDDEIYIYDNYGNKYIYMVFNSYEVNKSDLSPIFNYNQSLKELTLITCNNLNQNRLIVKAHQLN